MGIGIGTVGTGMMGEDAMRVRSSHVQRQTITCIVSSLSILNTRKEKKAFLAWLSIVCPRKALECS